MSRALTLLIPETDVRTYPEWTPCEAFRFAPVEDGTARLELKGVEPAEQDRECDWCQGRGSALQVGPAGQTAEVPCVNCGGTGRVNA